MAEWRRIQSFYGLHVSQELDGPSRLMVRRQKAPFRWRPSQSWVHGRMPGNDPLQ